MDLQQAGDLTAGKWSESNPQTPSRTRMDRWKMPDDSIEQKRQQIIESYEREQKVFEKAYEDGAKLLKKSLEEKNLAGIDQARKNMNEASEILGDLVRGKNQALDEL